MFERSGRDKQASAFCASAQQWPLRAVGTPGVQTKGEQIG